VVTTSLLNLKLERLLPEVQKLAGVKLPKDVTEISLEPDLNLLHIRFRKPVKAELGEPLHPKIHLFRERETGEIVAVDILDPEEMLSAAH